MSSPVWHDPRSFLLFKSVGSSEMLRGRAGGLFLPQKRGRIVLRRQTQTASATNRSSFITRGQNMALTEKLETFDPAKKIRSLFDEFKSFAFKGNVVDLALGVIIGAAFRSIIKSLVDNIIMPVISIVLPGEKGYIGWHTTINGVDIPFGKFIGEVVNFLIVALVLFLFIKKFLGWLMRAKKEEAATPPMSKDQLLLTEIRDLLKQRGASSAASG